MRNYAGFLALFLLLAAASGRQTARDLRSFFKQNVGLSDSEIARIGQGQAVAKILDSPKPSQVFVFGAVSINAQPSAYIRLASNLEKLKSLPGYLAVQRFSSPPLLSDLSGFEIDADDVDELKKCKPADCDVQLPAEKIQEFRTRIDWSSPNAGTQVNHLIKDMALKALLAYQQGGNAALGIYEDKDVPTRVSEQFHSLLARSNVLPEKFPALHSYLLSYPKGSLPDSSSTFYWEKVNFGLKPTLRVNQQITARMATEHGLVDVVATKQLYASHYFQAALELYFCLPQSPSGFYLITVKGSEQDGLTGVKGRIIKKVATGKTRSALEQYLAAIKKELEH
jgi:hypothetical protein